VDQSNIILGIKVEKKQNNSYIISQKRFIENMVDTDRKYTSGGIILIAF